MNFVTWLLVYLQNLILYHILSCIVIYLLMSFYTGAPFILFLWLHRYYHHLCSPPLPSLPSVLFLVLMAAVHPFNGAEVDAMGGGIYAIQLSMVLRLSEVTAAASSSNNVGIGSRIVQIGNRAGPVMLVSGSDRLSANFAIYLGTPHINAPSLCNMAITPPPTSHSVTRPQKILSLGFLTPAPINMLLRILLV
jgi:hypothetical protein